MLEAFQKKYSNNTVLRNIDLKINSKEIIGLIGPNGSGKTTFMRIIVGLIKDFEGTIEFNESIKNKGIGCIIESPNFYPYMTGYENLKFFSNILGEFNEKRVQETPFDNWLSIIKDQTADKDADSVMKKIRNGILHSNFELLLEPGNLDFTNIKIKSGIFWPKDCNLSTKFITLL